MVKIRNRKLNEGEIIPLSNDFMFTEVFNNKENIEILEYFISGYFDIDIKQIKGNLKILSRNLRIENKKEKNKQIDLLLDYNKEKINIELNNDLPKGKLDRNVVYISKVHSRNLKYAEKNYNNITKTIQINLNNFGCNKYNLIESYYLKNDKGDKLTEKLQIDFVDMAKSLDPCYNEVDERERKIRRWCKMFLSKTKKELEEYIGDDLMSDEIKNKLVETVEELSGDDEMVYLYTELSDRELTFNTMMDDAKKEGLKEASIEIAKNMINMKMSIEDISKATGLSINDIEKL